MFKKLILVFFSIFILSGCSSYISTNDGFSSMKYLSNYHYFVEDPVVTTAQSHAKMRVYFDICEYTEENKVSLNEFNEKLFSKLKEDSDNLDIENYQKIEDSLYFYYSRVLEESRCEYFLKTYKMYGE